MLDVRPILPVWQRACDLVLAVLVLIVALPVMGVLALCILVTMGRPILFRQVRPGLLGREFQIIKLRTMRTTAYSSGDASPDAARITRLGAFLRKTSLDELPELFCVIRGEMSLVGPRPLLVEYVPYYTERELVRFSVRPGLTGLAQLEGRNSLAWDRRLNLDVQFVEELSPALYFKLLLRTAWHLVFPESVAVDSYSVVHPLHVERAGRPRAS